MSKSRESRPDSNRALNDEGAKRGSRPYANGVGRLTSTSFPAGSTQHAYNPQGQLTVGTQKVNAQTGANSALITSVVTYGYDAAGLLTSITYPSGRKLTLTYTNGQLTVSVLARHLEPAR